MKSIAAARKGDDAVTLQARYEAAVPSPPAKIVAAATHTQEKGGTELSRGMCVRAPLAPSNMWRWGRWWSSMMLCPDKLHIDSYAFDTH
jgi:hypothetical protein